jgi:HAD superfamily hydrolase (TIGR01509 family)
MSMAVIFDMDGVIVDSEPRHERAFLEVVEQIGYAGRHGLRFADYIGRSDKELWLDFMAKNSPVQSFEELLALKRERMIQIIRRERPLFPGLRELLEIVAKSHKLGLASGSERPIIDEVLNLDGLARFFSVSVSASEVERGKPEPDIFLKTAALLGVAPADCWIIEDSIPGVAAGLAAGMQVIAITNTHAPAELEHAHYVVQSYPEIAKLVSGQASLDVRAPTLPVNSDRAPRQY